jgi:hypothetical protein
MARLKFRAKGYFCSGWNVERILSLTCQEKKEYAPKEQKEAEVAGGTHVEQPLPGTIRTTQLAFFVCRQGKTTNPGASTMKRVFLIVGFSLGAAAFSLTLPHPDQLFAVTGCCKARGSYWASWYKNKKNFKDCEDLNQEIDWDDVFEESGQIWWDVICESS